MPRQQLPDTAEEGLARERELECQVILKRLEVRLDSRQEREQGFDLRGEVDDGPDLRVVEWLDPEAVADAHEGSGRFVPERECEHSAEAAERLAAPPAVRPDQGLRVTAGAEPFPGGFELASQLGVVVELAVVGDPAAGLVAHRLMAVLDVDDAEPPVAESHVAVRVPPHAGVIGTSVRKQLPHDLQAPRELRNRAPGDVNGSGYAAHAVTEPAAPVRGPPDVRFSSSAT